MLSVFGSFLALLYLRICCQTSSKCLDDREKELENRAQKAEAKMSQLESLRDQLADLNQQHDDSVQKSAEEIKELKDQHAAILTEEKKSTRGQEAEAVRLKKESEEFSTKFEAEQAACEKLRLLLLILVIYCVLDDQRMIGKETNKRERARIDTFWHLFCEALLVCFRSSIEKHASDAAALQQKLDSCEQESASEAAKTKHQVKEFQTKLIGATSDTDDARQRADDAETKVQELKDELNMTDSKYRKEMKSVLQLESSNEKMSSELKQLKEDMKAAQQAMHRLEASAALVAGEVSADVFEVAAGAASAASEIQTAEFTAAAAKEKQQTQQRMLVTVATAEAALAQAEAAGDTEAVAEAQKALKEAHTESTTLTASSSTASEAQQRMTIRVATAEAALAEAKAAGDTEAAAEAQKDLSAAHAESVKLTASSSTASDAADSPKLTTTFTTIATALEAQKQQIKLLSSEKMYEEMQKDENAEQLIKVQQELDVSKAACETAAKETACTEKEQAATKVPPQAPALTLALKWWCG